LKYRKASSSTICAGRMAQKICGNSFAANLWNEKGSPRNGTFRGEEEEAFATGVAFYAQAAYDFLTEE
ncbi:MAG: hypothetical protein IIY00_01630, partial [Clostridia bacterium]|nr:hypothetical protein [Clostridia bacterium]